MEIFMSRHENSYMIDFMNHAIEIQQKKNYHFIFDNMKTKQQIQERIKFLESRQKDGIQVNNTLLLLRWALTASVDDMHEELVNSVTNP